MKMLNVLTITAMIVVSVSAQGATILLSGVERSILANISGTDPLVFTNIGSFNQSMQNSAEGDFASADQSSDITLDGNVLSVVASGDVSQNGDGQTWSNLGFTFTIDTDFYYYVSANSAGSFSRIMLDGGASFLYESPSSIGDLGTNGTQAGTISAGTHTFLADCNSLNDYWPLPGHFDVIFSVSPGSNSPPPSPVIVTSAGSVFLKWPISATNVVPESSADLVSNLWTPVTNTPTADGAMLSLPIDTAQPTRFFRLTRIQP